MRGDEGQLIILTGFIAAIALVTITLMLNDVIYATNTASIETIQSTKFDTEEILTTVKREVDFARRVNPDASSFALHLTNFSQNLSKIYAARGIAVDLNWTDVNFTDPVVRNTSFRPSAIAYCGYAERGNSNESGLRSWLKDLGITFTDYSTGGRCDDQGQNAANLLFIHLCRGSSSTANNQRCDTSDPSVTLNVSTVIFEFDRLSPKSSTGSYYCGAGSNDTTGGNFLNTTQCRTLQNWTYLGGTLIKTGANSTNSPENTTLLDLFTANYNTWRPNASQVTLGVRRLDIAVLPTGGCLVNNSTSGLFKNAANGTIVNFSRGGMLIQQVSGSNLSIYINGDRSDCSEACDYGTGVCGIAVSWTYGAGKVYYFPHLQGEVRTGNRAIINDPDNLRPVLNLFPIGGDCRVGVRITFGSVSYATTLYC